MLLQELYSDENKDIEFIFGVEVDENSLSPDFSIPPSNLKEIGFVFKVDDEGMIDETLIDVVINYGLTNLPRLFEIPSQLVSQKRVEVKYIIQLANSMGVSLSFLPPGHPLVGDLLTQEEYRDVLSSVLKEMLAKPNFDCFVYPISNFFEYLVLERIVGKDALREFKATNYYVKENFSNIMSVEDSNLFKEDIRKLLYEFYDNEEHFNFVCSTMIEAIIDKNKELFKKQIQTYIEEKNKTKN